MSQQGTTRRADWSERIRLVGVGILAGAIAGLIVGIGARINMRVVAVAIHQTPVLTLATPPLGGSCTKFALDID